MFLRKSQGRLFGFEKDAYLARVSKELVHPIKGSMPGPRLNSNTHLPSSATRLHGGLGRPVDAHLRHGETPKRVTNGYWSGRLDSNQRPSAPKADALPGCATPRRPKVRLSGFVRKSGLLGVPGHSGLGGYGAANRGWRMLCALADAQPPGPCRRRLREPRARARPKK